MTRFPRRPPRLQTIHSCYAPPLYFVTFCTRHRARILDNESVYNAFLEFVRRGYAEFQIATGRFVIMPDHVHFFVQGPVDFRLSEFVRLLKRALSSVLKREGLSRPHWQEGYFDHLVRQGESYAQKWEYVRENPVRAGLVGRVDDWPYQGEVVRIEKR
jgi:putative transposase